VLWHILPKNVGLGAPRKTNKKMALPEQPHCAEPADGPSSEDRIARRHPVSAQASQLGVATSARRAYHAWRGECQRRGAQDRRMRAEIRPGEPGDAAFLADTWRAMLDELDLAPGGLVSDWRERLIEHFSAGIAGGSQGWLVAAAGHERVGTAAAFMLASVLGDVQRRRTAVLAGVYVFPAYRRRGLARLLVAAALDWCRQHGCTEIRLQASEAAEPLYRTLGFEDACGLVLKIE
jgi:GNAT superfamily N-acetyltransferase